MSKERNFLKDSMKKYNLKRDDLLLIPELLETDYSIYLKNSPEYDSYAEVYVFETTGLLLSTKEGDIDRINTPYEDYTYVRLLLKVEIYFDGIRHVHVTPDDEIVGYYHYANPYALSFIWKKIGEIAEKYSWLAVNDKDWEWSKELLKQTKEGEK